MNNNFLIPANSKRSLLIFSLFTKFDLILFGSGISITLILLMILQPTTIALVVITLAPALITGFLVLPISNYHNVLTILINVFKFYTERQKFVWKGWCVLDEKEDRKK